MRPHHPRPAGQQRSGGPRDRSVARHRRTAGPLRRSARPGDQLHPQALAGDEQHTGSDRPEHRHHGGARCAGRGRPGRGPRHRHRGVARHDGARLGEGRLARPVPEGHGIRRPRAGRSHLAGRQQLGHEAGHRTSLRLLQPAQRTWPVRLLRPRRRLPDHRERGRCQALRHERAVQPAAPRLHHPAPGGCRVDR
ncbi:hypothetical protein SGPA1_41132 [Streptomyces misionensis JCM 4497]